MASERAPSVEEQSDQDNGFVDRTKTRIDPLLSPMSRAARLVTSSFFRFIIFLGIVFLILGTFAVEGHLSGHFGIYGVTLIVMGAVGRLIIYWKVKDTS